MQSIDLTDQSPQIVTKDLFKSYMMTRSSLSKGSFQDEIELPSETKISAPNTTNARIPAITFDEANMTLLIWNERTDSVTQHLWMLDGSTPQIMKHDLEERKSELLFSNKLIVFSSYSAEKNDSPSFMAVSEIVKNRLKPLWQQESSSKWIQWRTCQTGNKLLRIANDLERGEAALQFLESRTGRITKTLDVPVNFKDFFDDLFHYNDSWVAVKYKFNILLVDVREETVKCLGHKSGDTQLEFTGKVKIKDSTVYAVAMNNSVVAFDASSGNANFVYSFGVEAPIEDLYISNRRLFVWSKNQLICQNLKVQSPQDMACNMSERCYFKITNDDFVSTSEEPNEVYRDIVGVQVVQNVVVICYTINDVLQDTCEIKLAFLQAESNDTDPVNELSVSLENSSVRPETVQLLTTATSIAVNIPLCQKMLIYNFFERL